MAISFDMSNYRSDFMISDAAIPQRVEAQISKEQTGQFAQLLKGFSSPGIEPAVRSIERAERITRVEQFSRVEHDARFERIERAERFGSLERIDNAPEPAVELSGPTVADTGQDPYAGVCEYTSVMDLARDILRGKVKLDDLSPDQITIELLKALVIVAKTENLNEVEDGADDDKENEDEGAVLTYKGDDASKGIEAVTMLDQILAILYRFIDAYTDTRYDDGKEVLGGIEELISDFPEITEFSMLYNIIAETQAGDDDAANEHIEELAEMLVEKVDETSETPEAEMLPSNVDSFVKSDELPPETRTVEGAQATFAEEVSKAIGSENLNLLDEAVKNGEIGEVKIEVKPKVNTEVKAKVEVMPDVNTEVSFEVEAKPDLITEIQPEVIAEVKSENDAEAEFGVNTELMAEAKPKLNNEVKPEVSAEADFGVNAEIRSEANTEVRAEVNTGEKSDVKPEVNNEVKAEDNTEVKFGFDTEVKAEANTELRPETKVPAVKEQALSEDNTSKQPAAVRTIDADDRAKAIAEELEMLRSARLNKNNTVQKPVIEEKTNEERTQIPSVTSLEVDTPIVFAGRDGSEITVRPSDVVAQAAKLVETAIAESSENRGQTEYSLVLNPEELGRITVKLTKAADGAVSVTIAAENARTQRILDQNSHLMQSNLRDDGIRLENWQVVRESQQETLAQDYNGSSKNPYYREDTPQQDEDEDVKLSFADIIAAM